MRPLKMGVDGVNTYWLPRPVSTVASVWTEFKPPVWRHERNGAAPDNAQVAAGVSRLRVRGRGSRSDKAKRGADFADWNI